MNRTPYLLLIFTADMHRALRYASTSATVKSINDIQHLYYVHPYSPGCVFFSPKGTRLFDKLTTFARSQMQRFGFDEVLTPQMFHRRLWQTSGHWDHYQNDMFGISDGFGCGNGAQEEIEYSLKPMNCPGHCLLYQSEDRSFRGLPLRFADFSPLHRNEASGALTGLTRVRRFHQDDGHIFCRPDQMHTEIANSIQLVDMMYGVFGLKYTMVLSTRPEEYMGDLNLWNEAERSLSQAIAGSSTSFDINEGDGAFYGPKIDFIVTDNIGNKHQTATIQLDFQLPRKFGLTYDAETGKETPVIIHRAAFGSLERFMAILIDHYGGKWPFWLNPCQAVVLPIADKYLEYAEKVAASLKFNGADLGEGRTPAPLYEHTYDIEVFGQAEPLSGRIRRAQELHPSYMIVVGEKEVESKTISVRRRGSKQLESYTVAQLLKEFDNRVAAYT